MIQLSESLCMNYDILSEATAYLKTEKDGVHNMCRKVEALVKEICEESREEWLEEGHAQGREEANIEMAVSLVKMGKLTFEEISEATKLELDVIKKLAEKHSA